MAIDAYCTELEIVDGSDRWTQTHSDQAMH